MNDRRYFYPASRAHHAHCMDRDFGMQFTVKDGGLLVPGVIPFVQTASGKFYVHPDSLHLLQPVPTSEDGTPGDLCNVIGTRFFGSYHECLGSAGSDAHIRVAERNGLPFFSPESEPGESLSA